jgi:hypothetical protein
LNAHHSREETEHVPLVTRLAPMYRLSAFIWMLYSVALLLTSVGSQLLEFAETFRLAMTVATALVTIAMLVRALVPGRPSWTRWALLALGGISVSTFTLTLFAADMAEGGLTAGRVAYALLLLVPALGVYVSWVGEKVVAEL